MLWAIKKHRDAARTHDVIDQLHEIRFAAHIEIGERFVKQQQIRLSDQCFGKKYPLQFPARKRSELAMRQFFGADGTKDRKRFFHPLLRRTRSPMISRKPETHQLQRLNSRLFIYGMPLWDIADPRIAAPRGSAQKW